MNFDRQIRYFEMQDQRVPDARFWLPLADLHRRNGDPEIALRVVQEGMAGRAAGAAAHWVLACTLRDLGRLDEARREAAAVLELDPAHRGAPGLLALEDPVVEAPEVTPDDAAEETAQELEEPAAAEQAEPAPAPEPAPPVPETTAAGESGRGVFVTRTLADIYLSQGHQDKALDILYKVLEQHPEREDIVAQIAAVEASSGRDGDAARPARRPDAARDEANRERFDAWLEREAGGES